MNKLKIFKEIRDKIANKWDAKFWWIPLDGYPYPDNTTYFNRGEFEENYGFDNLIKSIEAINSGEQIYLLTEIKEDEKINLNQISTFDVIEKIYVNENADWIVYLSHENTIAIGGAKLIEQIRKNWSQCEQFEFPWEKIN